MRFDFLGVPISAEPVVLLDEDGRSRWMTGKRAKAVADANAESRAAA
jgi:hypothetical protein